jgi:hypothetical protein
VSLQGVPPVSIGIAVASATKKALISAVFGLFFVADVVAMPTPIDGLPLQWLNESTMNSL